MEIVYKGVGDLIPYEKNPRNNEQAVDKVANSIREFGFKVPIVVDKYNVVVCGHTRLKAAKKLGLAEVPCVYADDLTEQQIKAYRIADNKVSELASWDDELLAQELEDMTEFDMSEFGDFEDVICEEEREIIEDEVPDEVQSICKRGDIWQLGNHRLMCGDSTDINDVQKLMNGEKADMLLTDPPYNVNYQSSNGLKIKNDSMDNEKFYQFIYLSFKNAKDVLKDGSSYYIWHADSEGLNFRKACEEGLAKVRQCLIWVKNSLVLGRQDYQWKHEPCLYGWTDGGKHYFTNRRDLTTVIEEDLDIKKMKKEEMRDLLQKILSDKTQTTILRYDKPLKNSCHPTMKPIKLLSELIQNSSVLDNLIIDLFGGSGSTLIACEQLNRKCYMMELDEHYCDVIIERFKRFNPESDVKKINNE